MLSVLTPHEWAHEATLIHPQDITASRFWGIQESMGGEKSGRY